MVNVNFHNKIKNVQLLVMLVQMFVNSLKTLVNLILLHFNVFSHFWKIVVVQDLINKDVMVYRIVNIKIIVVNAVYMKKNSLNAG